MSFLSAMEAARSALESGRPRRALAVLPRAVPAAFRSERDLLEAEALRAQGFFARAEAIYRRLLRSDPRRDPEVWLQAALGSAAGLRSVGEAAAAGRLLNRAEAVARRAKALWVREPIRLERALVARAEGKWTESLRALRSLLNEALRRRDDAEASFLLWAIAGAERFSGDLAGARRSFDRSLAHSRRAKDPSGEGYATLGLGGVTRVQGRLADSARFYSAARRAFARTDDLFAQAYAHCGYANALRQAGERGEAERHYRRAHRLYSSLGDPVDLAYVDWGLGKLRLDAGRPSEALPYLRKASTAFRRGGEARGEALAELCIAQAEHTLGRTGDAERRFDRAVRLSRSAALHAHLEIYT